MRSLYGNWDNTIQEKVAENLNRAQRAADEIGADDADIGAAICLALADVAWAIRRHGGG